MFFSLERLPSLFCALEFCSVRSVLHRLHGSHDCPVMWFQSDLFCDWLLLTARIHSWCAVSSNSSENVTFPSMWVLGMS